MNDQKQVAFDPKVYDAWRNLAAAIINPQFDLDAMLHVQNQSEEV